MVKKVSCPDCAQSLRIPESILVPSDAQHVKQSLNQIVVNFEYDKVVFYEHWPFQGLKMSTLDDVSIFRERSRC